MRNVTMKVGDAGEALSDPSAIDVADTLAWMTAKEDGPSVLILESNDGSFAQAAGGEGRYSAEWKDVNGNQWKAARRNASATGKAMVHTSNRRFVPVTSNEVLSFHEASIVMAAYLEGRPRPEGLAWRKMEASELG